MFTINTQSLKKSTYVGLSFTSLILSTSADAGNNGSHINDNFIIPYGNESKLLYEHYDTRKDEVIRDIEKPEADDGTAVRIAKKYGLKPPSSHKGPGLIDQLHSATENFENECKLTKKEFKTQDEEISKNARAGVNIGGSIAEIATDATITNPQANEITHLIIEKIKGLLFMYF